MAGRARSPGTSSPSTASGTCCWSAGAARTRPAPRELVAELTDAGRRGRASSPATSPTATRSPRCSPASPAEHPLTAVVHAAGVLDDGVVDVADPRAARRGAAAQGRRRLAPARADPRPATCRRSCCSPRSPASLGAPGQANYAAANAFLDALAAPARHARACPPLSLAWGLWAHASGMTGDLDRGRPRRGSARGGMPRCPPSRAWPCSTRRCALDAAAARAGAARPRRAARPGRAGAAAAAARPGTGAGPRAPRGRGRPAPARWPSGWPGCPRRTGTRSLLDLVRGAGRRRARARRRRTPSTPTAPSRTSASTR